jgi:hypothetical protein
MLEPYRDFFTHFNPDKEFDMTTLRDLYQVARHVKASMNWLRLIEVPLAVIRTDDWFDSDAHINVCAIFAK